MFTWGRIALSLRKCAHVDWNWPISREKYLKLDWSVKMPFHWLINGVAGSSVVMCSWEGLLYLQFSWIYPGSRSSVVGMRNLKTDISVWKRLKCFLLTLREFKNAKLAGCFGFVFQENWAQARKSNDYRDLIVLEKLLFLKTVSSTFQDVDFDGSLLPLFIRWCYNHGIKKLPNHWGTRWHYFCDTIGYHSNAMSC